jgi:hypothetical protein
MWPRLCVGSLQPRKRGFEQDPFGCDAWYERALGRPGLMASLRRLVWKPGRATVRVRLMRPSRIALLCCFVAVSAYAQKKVGVASIGLDPAAERQALVAYRVYVETVAAKHPQLVDLAAAARADDKRARDAKSKQAADLSKQAQDAMDGLELGAAVDKLDHAVGLLEDADLTTDFPALSNALALRAVVLHLDSSGAKASADEALARLFAVSPDYRFPSGRWAPEVQSWLEAGRQTAKQLSPVAVDLQTPQPALVWVDGLYRGISPLQLSGLLPGGHYLTVLAQGSNLTQHTFVAEAGRAVQQDLDFGPAGKALVGQLDALRSGAAAGAVSAPGSALCASNAVDEVLVLGFREEGGTPKREAIRVARDGSFARNTTDVAGHGEDALESAEGTAVASLSGPLGAPTGGTATATSGEELLSKRSWSYIALGGGAAALIVGIGLGASAQSQVNNAKANLINDAPSYDAAIKSAQNAAVAANVFYAVAAVGAGVGGWFLYSSLTSGGGATPPSKPPESDEHLSIVPTPGGAAFTLSGRF